MTGMGAMAGYAAAGLPALLVADAAMAGDAERAIALAGGRLLQRIGWDELSERIGDHAARPVLVVEAEGVADAVLEYALPRLGGYAAALDLNLVVALQPGQIDIATAHLFGDRVQWLCSPSMAERVAALAVAGHAHAGLALHDSWRESEAVRLQRLNEEVARIADVLAKLTRTESGRGPGGGGEIGDRRPHYDAGPPVAARPEPQDVRRTIRARRIRDQFFGAGLFEDPAWDMLLDLFAAELEGTRVSVSSLCIAAAVAPTTALRWITKMTEMALFVRQPDPLDRRRAFMALSRQASEAMHGYMAALRRIDASAG